MIAYYYIYVKTARVATTKDREVAFKIAREYLQCNGDSVKIVMVNR